MNQIKSIFKFYENVWKFRKNEFNSVKQCYPHPSFSIQPNSERFCEAKFLKKYSFQYNVGHVVDFYSALKFLEYFNDKWNFNKIFGAENIIKSQNVTHFF